jgi:hypothetical protein
LPKDPDRIVRRQKGPEIQVSVGVQKPQSEQVGDKNSGRQQANPSPNLSILAVHRIVSFFSPQTRWRFIGATPLNGNNTIAMKRRDFRAGIHAGLVEEITPMGRNCYTHRTISSLRGARLVEEMPEISELDLNPIIALPPGQGCLIVDARIGVTPLD